MAHEGYSIKEAQFWRIVLSLGFASLYIFAAMYAFQPLLPLFKEEFSISVSYASLSMSVSTVGLILGLIILGFLSDRNGRTHYIKLSLIGSTLPFFLMAVSDSFLWMVILRFIQGFALAGVPAAALAYISEEIHQQFMSVATALYISCNGIGGMIGRFVTGYMGEHFSWQLSFHILGFTGILIFIAILLTLPKSRNFTASQEGFSKDIEGFLFHLKNPNLLIVFGLGVVLQLSFTGMWTFLPFHLMAPPYSLSLDAISYTYFAYSFGVIGAPLAGWLAGYFGLRTVRRAGVITMSVGLLLTLGTSLTLIGTGLCIVCLGFFTAHTLTAASVGKEAEHHKGSASSIYLVSYYIGVTIGSTFLSPLWTIFDWNGLVTFTSLLPVVYIAIIRMRRKMKSA
ncbi:hypothetical protein OXB_1140 [Bacillus sp. OxB-1]|uniref:MFS transporter n=1 Tax=Bacillus sp. (strain OxB-1) TaxID=98228 RepID=UPI000581CC9D|nr:MFS transporter [Bacillus sp. OxB-1]BAQ09612.1 hypothetical protein OXB_1140 [Bacillus sp. OxB-1]